MNEMVIMKKSERVDFPSTKSIGERLLVLLY